MVDLCLDDLLLRLDFRDPDPEVIDLSPEGGVVSTLKESRVDCLATDKVSLITLTTNEPDTKALTIGRVSLLLPPPLSRPLASLPIFH